MARTQRALGLLAIGSFLLLFVVPFPFSTKAPAVVWLPEQAQIRPQIDGFIKALPIPDGAEVKAGDLVAVLENAELLKTRDKLASRLDGLRADQFQLLLKEPAKAQNITEEISSTEKELAHTEEQISQLKIHAQTDGKLVMPHQADALGTFIHRGDNLGYVFESTAVRVRVAVPEKDAYLVKNNTQSVNVWMVEAPSIKTPVKMTMDVPAATRMLPSSALGDRAGGPYVTDPSDKEGDLALEPVFLFDLKLDGSTMERVGGRAWVRFDHGFMPLGLQLYKHAMQLFIKNFEPSSS
ncbi:MAG TPA: efflux RND transporter periplasmic adaptor subunit [Methylophilus sp.]|nr:efflux RND transporter periplasmic adaptor subunit [Methylophilus sp.]HQQ32623.1 efflux RND transporter periplasmic adaptor subunit [Methylophilus sp.]